jgi:uncharacterized protein (TIGR02391 family)
MNRDWALEQLNVFIEQTNQVRRDNPNILGTRTRAENAEITGQAQVVEQILDRLLPRWRELEMPSHAKRWQRHREAAIRVREVIQREQEVSENLGENAPELSAAELHPWVWSGASSLWQSGHYREAVEAALKKLNAETQNKVGRRDIGETKLFQEAFTTDAAGQDRGRLRRMEPDDSKTYQSVQRGAMSLAEGIYSGIRNPFSHEAEQDLTEQEALEYLAAASVLARWVDDASVERPEATT